MTRRTLIIIGLALGMFVAALDTTIVSTAMPTVIASLGGTELYPWVFAAYMLTFTTASPIFGKLSDLYGQKVLYAISLGIFLLGSALAGGAQTMVELIIFRGLQGIGGGALMALAFTVVGHIFSPAERPFIRGILSATWAISAVLGPVTGGFLIEHVSWRWIFYVNIPIGIIPAALILANLKDVRHPDRKPVIDFAGAILLISGIVSLLFALLLGDSYGWTSTRVIALFVGAAALLAVFLFVESRSSEPIVPLSLFRLRTFAVCNLLSMVAGTALLGIIGFIPLFVQGVLGGSPTTAGLAVMPLSIGWPLGSITGGQAVNRFGYRNVAITGMILMVAGFYFLSGLTVDTVPRTVGGIMFVVGLGMGLLTPTVSTAVQNAVPRAHMGVASASTPFYQNIGGAVGVSALGAILTGEMARWASRLVDANLIASVSSAGTGFHDPQLLLRPDTVSLLPAALLSALQQSLANSLHTVFTVALFTVAVGLLVSTLVPDSTPAQDAERQELFD